jgi:folate-binding protein YgfZ
MTKLQDIQREGGAIFTDLDSTPESFNNDSEAITAARETAAIYDRTHWGLIQVTGGDRQRFLHNQTTNDFNKLKSGEGCETVFVTSTARTIDLVTAYVQEDRILLLVSPSRQEQLLAWMDRFLFPMDKVELANISSKYAIFSLFGAKTPNLLAEWLEEEILCQPEGNHLAMEIENINLFLGVGNGLALPGYNLIIPQEKAGEIWQILTAKGALPMGNKAYEKLRILQGRPKPDAELTEDYNPLEVGLWQTISFEKGCYIGQETIARLNTYQGIKQKLWGIRVNQPVMPGAIVTVAGVKVGVITSYTDTENGGLALGYIRTKAGDVGLKVEIEEAKGEVVKLPFVTHQ